jgi:hypothetical protein
LFNIQSVSAFRLGKTAKISSSAALLFFAIAGGGSTIVAE